ncbi:hypothetical protein BHE74_00007557 [Ensete ventricosum]|nr:hypothetical protein BHE74_00007557 [Ensete ventricosum]
MWYSRLKPHSVSSFDQLAREFESNFLASSKPKPLAAALLALSEKDKEPLSYFVSRFAVKIKAIDVIVRDPTSGGDSTSGQKAYTRAAIEKCPDEADEPRISFEAGEAEYPDHADALVISVRVTNVLVKRVMVDNDSSTNILCQDAFQKLRLTTTDQSLMSSTLTGFTGDSIVPLGTTTLTVTVGQEPRSKILMVTFMVVGLPTTSNIILGRSTLNKLRAVVTTYHRAIKFPTKATHGSHNIAT